MTRHKKAVRPNAPHLLPHLRRASVPLTGFVGERGSGETDRRRITRNAPLARLRRALAPLLLTLLQKESPGATPPRKVEARASTAAAHVSVCKEVNGGERVGASSSPCAYAADGDSPTEARGVVHDVLTS